jgi:predicted AAA+ superfamily ATPase
MAGYKTNEEEFGRLFNNFLTKIKNTKTEFVRYLEMGIDWNNRFIALRGARGCGKTTFLYQYIKRNLKLDESVIYVNLDDLYFTTHRLIDFTEDFVTHGGKYLFLDEVHKYPNWSLELKTIYDTYDDLRITFTSSSILELYKGNADLSRRLVCYDMEGMSFREFLKFEHGFVIEKIPLKNILSNHITIAMELTGKIKMLPAFNEYLTLGYYPYYKENKTAYHGKLANTVNLMIEIDLPAIHSITYTNVYKLKKLVSYLAMNGPYKPDITKLSGQLEVSRNSLLAFLDYLKNAKILNLLKTDKGNESIMTKPEKVYMNNTNLMYALGSDTTNVGAIREAFFFSQLNVNHKVTYTEIGDFLIDDAYTFEVGGKNKSMKQIKEVKNSYVVYDGTEMGFENKIPLWVFGLMY